ncbi:MAG: nuclear transport factor 2 family protein [Chlamydiales bacterium]|nr:nuclear transport factor 2 family protein [Chlamydiia bacterium]MCP5507153.1 nuclear transport factor 2 family protein [Chlamydiales bacterium]
MRKTEESTTEVISAVKEFYSALHGIFEGKTGGMESVWSHADDVTYLGPQGGILKGWKHVFNAWKEQASLSLKGNIEPKDIHIIQQGDIAIIQNYEVGTNYINGTAKSVKIRALNIFRREDGSWKMISHQTDLLSFV